MFFLSSSLSTNWSSSSSPYGGINVWYSSPSGIDKRRCSFLLYIEALCSSPSGSDGRAAICGLTIIKTEETNKKSRASLPYLHRTGSKLFAQVQSEMKKKASHDVDQLELFHESRFSIKDGWVNDKARDAYLEMQKLIEASSQEGSTLMTSAEICKQVLGHRSGHIKGLGWDPKPSSSYCATFPAQYKRQLENKVDQMEGDKAQMKADYENMKEANTTLTLKYQCEKINGLNSTE